MLILSSCLVLSPALAVAAGSASGSTSAEIGAAAVPRSPESVAAGHYKKGMKLKKKAWKFDEKAANSEDPGKRDKLLAKAQKQYTRAIEQFASALRILPGYYEAATELGYVLRKTGDFRKSVGAYNYALGVNPDYHEAIEYRGEALLAMGMLEEAKNDYMRLFRGNPGLAAELMTAMETWIYEQQPADEAAVEFAAWVEERKELATISAELSLVTPRSW
jgi:tetratricopeptide (TPR) repeat protein